MSTATMPMTADDLLALPDDGRRRWLIRGELREQDMTIRNRYHSQTMSHIAGELYSWWRKQPKPRGAVVSGEAGVRLPDDEETVLGVDVAYVPPDVMVRQTDETTIIESVPTLVVEILSPSDTIEELDEMVAACLRVGVPMVWLVDPGDRSVTIYRPGCEPKYAGFSDELDGVTVLPGFRVPVERFFD